MQHGHETEQAQGNDVTGSKCLAGDAEGDWAAESATCRWSRKGVTIGLACIFCALHQFLRGSGLDLIAACSELSSTAIDSVKTRIRRTRVKGSKMSSRQKAPPGIRRIFSIHLGICTSPRCDSQSAYDMPAGASRSPASSTYLYVAILYSSKAPCCSAAPSSQHMTGCWGMRIHSISTPLPTAACSC